VPCGGGGGGDAAAAALAAAWLAARTRLDIFPCAAGAAHTAYQLGKGLYGLAAAAAPYAAMLL
jgi:hypothetical protein